MNNSALECLGPKKCFRCGETLPRSEFYMHPQMADGLLGKCKPCTRADMSNSRGQKQRDYDRLRYKQRRHEHVARIAVQAAITNGTIVRPAGCWACGTEGATEAHHADYQNKLGVVFLCAPCHMQCHKMTTALTKENDYAEKLGRLLDREAAA